MPGTRATGRLVLASRSACRAAGRAWQVAYSMSGQPSHRRRLTQEIQLAK